MVTDPFATTPTLVGERAVLVPLAPEHAEAMMELMVDPEVARLTGSHGEITRGEIDAWCAGRSDADDRLDFAVLDAESREFLGDMAVNELDDDNRSCSFRIALLERAAGRGVGTDAIGLMSDHVFGLGLHRISLEVYAHNPRARHVYERCGFVHEGTLRDALLWAGEWIDAHLMARLSERNG